MATGGTGTDLTPSFDDGWAALEQGVLDRANAERAAGGSCGEQSFPPSEPLVMDGLLRSVARAYSAQMADEQFFDHVAPDGSDPVDRMEDAGFVGAFPWGENIAAGYPSAEEVMDGWMASEGHCANLLAPGFGAIGVGYALREDDPAGLFHYWTQEFAGSPQP